MNPEDFGDELKSVTAIPDPPLLSTIIQNLANQLQDRGGGYLYFPAGVYTLGRFPASFRAMRNDVGEFADIVIPPEVTLWFAPGAVLVPLSFPEGQSDRGGLDLSAIERASVRVEIQGDIIAERRMIFGAPAAATAAMPGVGLILLTSRRILEVYPEWWGADPSGNPADSQVNTEAIQAAIDAAYNRRVTAQRRDVDTLLGQGFLGYLFNHRASIPVVMMGTYWVSRGITVGLRSGDTAWPTDPQMQTPIGGFELLGERGVGTENGGRPALIANTNFTGDALLSIRGPMGFRLEGLTLNAEWRADTCLEMAVIDGDWAPSTVEGCSALKGREMAVSLDGERVRRPNRPGRPSGLITDCWNLAFTRCAFSMGNTIAVFEGMGDGRLNDEAEFNLTLMDLRLGDNQGLELRGCWFRGAASPGIRARSGRFSANNCLSHLTRPPRVRLNGRDIARSPVTNSDGTFSRATMVESHADWKRPDYAHGCDVVIDTPEEPPRGAGSGSARIIPAGCTLREFQSHSWQLLGTRPVPAALERKASASAVILMNVRQICEFDKIVTWSRYLTLPTAPPRERRLVFLGFTEFDPPSVYWCTGGPGSHGAPLVVIGAQFSGDSPLWSRVTMGGANSVSDEELRVRLTNALASPNEAAPIRANAPAPLLQTIQVGPMVSAPIYAIGCDTNSGGGEPFAGAVFPLSSHYTGGGGERVTLGNVRRLRRSDVL